MKNKNFAYSIIALALSVIHVIVSIVMILRLPESIPTHFDIHWVCDGMGSRWTLLLTASLALIAALAHVGSMLWVYIVFFEMMVVNIAVPCIYAYIHKDDVKETAAAK